MENPTLPTNWLAALSNANYDGTTQFPCIAVGSRGDRHLGYSSRHTQVSVPATTNCILDVLTDGILTECHPFV